MFVLDLIPSDLSQISWCACKDDQTSADTTEGGEAVGAMSYVRHIFFLPAALPDYLKLFIGFHPCAQYVHWFHNFLKLLTSLFQSNNRTNHIHSYSSLSGGWISSVARVYIKMTDIIARAEKYCVRNTARNLSYRVLIQLCGFLIHPATDVLLIKQHHTGHKFPLRHVINVLLDYRKLLDIIPR